MGSLHVGSAISAVHLISLSGGRPKGACSSGLGHDGTRSTQECGDNNSGSSCADLVSNIARGLLVPSVPLSATAAHRLKQQVRSSNCYNGCRCNSKTSRVSGATATAGQTGKLQPDALLLRSLPTELLYDDAGLQLFDQITYLPEYYLTAAEADILAKSGPEIVRQCVADGTHIIELGAG